ncbi:MAG TPA: hypothetical protein DCS91_15130 [Microcoleaceae bacterium UBA11344]|nr:hypothetical protein [Microcoleaceae cyanobacterium UBA11344]
MVNDCDLSDRKSHTDKTRLRGLKTFLVRADVCVDANSIRRDYLDCKFRRLEIASTQTKPACAG